MASTAVAQPTITSRTPSPHTHNAPLATDVTIGFSQDMNNGTASASAVRVFHTQTHQPTGSVYSGGGTNTITLNPATNLHAGESVWVSVTQQARNLSSTALAPAAVYQFTATASRATAQFTANADVPVGSGARAIVTADVNGDGKLDLLTANPAANTVSVRFNDGTGTFTGTTDIGVGLSPRALTAADVDSDGDLDILVANANSSSISVLRNNGSGLFALASTVTVGDTPAALGMADINGDGALDLLVANFSGIEFWLNDGTGTFLTTGQAHASIPFSIISPLALVAADLDLDGDVDLLTSNNSTTKSVTVLLNNGDGTATAAPTFSPAAEISLGATPQAIATGDVDGDGDLDFLTANNQASNNVSVGINTGSGGFTTSALTVAGSPQAVALADVNGDGKVDLLTANRAANTVSVRLNNGAGGFSAPGAPALAEIPVGPGSLPQAIISADLNGDGTMDLLTADSGTNTASVLLNAPLPLPVTLVSFTAALRPNGVALNWATASEQENKGFAVEVSTARANVFRQIGFVASRNPTSTHRQAYSFVDQGPAVSPIRHYRLRQVDLDGTTVYSPVASVGSPVAQGQLSVFPNPFTSAVQLRLEVAEAGTAEITVRNSLGQTLSTQQVSIGQGPSYLPLQLPPLPPGPYLLTVRINGHLLHRTLTKVLP
ncbi:FG-GAP-like repeat-containing protein [Hymenobacter fastidiosus]